MKDETETSINKPTETPRANPATAYTVTKDCFIFGTYYLAGEKTNPMTEDQAAPFLRGGQIEAPKARTIKAKAED